MGHRSFEGYDTTSYHAQRQFERTFEESEDGQVYFLPDEPREFYTTDDEKLQRALKSLTREGRKLWGTEPSLIFESIYKPSVWVCPVIEIERVPEAEQAQYVREPKTHANKGVFKRMQEIETKNRLEKMEYVPEFYAVLRNGKKLPFTFYWDLCCDEYENDYYVNPMCKYFEHYIMWKILLFRADENEKNDQSDIYKAELKYRANEDEPDDVALLKKNGVYDPTVLITEKKKDSILQELEELRDKRFEEHKDKWNTVVADDIE